MQWTATAATDTVLTYDQLAYALRLDPDTAATSHEQSLVMDYLAAATEYAETMMGTSLCSRTITATFNPGEPLILPRGPVTTITSVTDSGTPVTWTASMIGHLTIVLPDQLRGGAISVVYQAGYGTASDVPADIRAAIRMHVGTLYEQRESTTDKPLTEVPNSLAAFYNLKRRSSLVG